MYEITSRESPGAPPSTVRNSRPSSYGRVRLPYLAFLSGPRAGEFVRLGDPVVTLGRGADCTVQIPDRSVSRAHARLYRDGETYLLEDLRSRNGSSVGRTTSPFHRLRSGDELALGDVRARFELCDDLEADLRRRLYDAAMRDDLTGLLHRGPFEEHLSYAVLRANSSGGDVSVILCDLDHFKAINDTYGHPAGDRILVAVARAAQNALRGGDVLARVGGEEFAVVLDGQSQSAASGVAERLRRAVSGVRVALGDATMAVTASLGVASIHEAEQPDPGSLLALADHRMYLAKQQGRDRVYRRFAGQ